MAVRWHISHHNQWRGKERISGNGSYLGCNGLLYIAGKPVAKLVNKLSSVQQA